MRVWATNILRAHPFIVLLRRSQILASRIFLVIALGSLLVGGYIANDQEDHISTSIEDWLKGLVINIPTTNLTVDTVDINVLPGGNCSMISVSRVSSDVIQGELIDEALALGVYGAGISCSLFVHVKESELISIDFGTAGLQVDITNSSLNGSLTILGDPVPESLKLSQCSTDIKISGLDFLGQGFAVELLHSLAGLIQIVANELLSTVLCGELETLLSKEMDPILVAIAKDMEDFIAPTAPPTFSPDPDSGILDLTDSKLILAVSIAAEALVPEINHYISQFTDGTGAVSFPFNESSITLVNTTSLGLVSIDIQSIKIGGLNTTSAIKGPTAVTSDGVQLHLDVGDLSISVDVRLTVDLSPGVLRGNDLVDNTTIALHLQGLDVGGTMVMDLRGHQLSVLKIDQLLHPGCLLHVAEDINISDLYLGFSKSALKLEDHSGKAVDNGLYDALGNTATYILEAYKTILETVLQSQINSEVLSVVQHEVTEVISYARNKYTTCPKPDLSEMSKTGITSIVWGVLSASFGLIGVLCILIGFFSRSRQQAVSKDRYDNTSIHEATRSLISEEISDLDMPQSDSRVLKVVQSGLRSSLAYSISSSEVIAVGIVLNILANIMLFISSNTAAGASVELFITYKSDTGDHGYVQLPTLFAFSLTNSVRGMWQAGVYPISLMIAVFSGAWPYLKLVMMLGCALAPSSSLSSSRRQSLLRFLDAYGKWSLIDSFVLVLFLVAFRLHLQTPPIYGSGESAALDIFVFPRYGFYTFLVATILSLCIGHTLAHMSRFSRECLAMRGPQSLSKQRLSMLAFRDPEVETQSMFSVVISQLLSVCMLGSLGLVLWSSFLDGIEFKFEGLTGLVLGERADRMYSLSSLGNNLANSAKNPKSFGVNFIASTFFVFSLAMPLVHLSLLSVLWLVPMGVAHRRRMSTACRIFDAWSGMDVYIISVIAAVLEVEQFAQFIIGSKCDVINVLLKSYFNGALHGNDKCFDLKATLGKGSWAVFGSALFYFIVSRIVHWLDTKIQEQEEKAQLPYRTFEEDENLNVYEYLSNNHEHTKRDKKRTKDIQIRPNRKKSKSKRKSKSEGKTTVHHINIVDEECAVKLETEARSGDNISGKSTHNDIEEIYGDK